MEEIPVDKIDWTSVANGFWILVIGLFTGITGIVGYKKRKPEADPQTVHASMIDTKMLERLVQSFESNARVLEHTNKLWEETNNLRDENNTQLAENTKVMRIMFDRMDEMKRVMNDLTHQTKRMADK